MPHTHEFDCRVCGAHLDSKDELARHTREQHTPLKANSETEAQSKPRGANA
jgi:hypothetical protein